MAWDVGIPQDDPCAIAQVYERTDPRGEHRTLMEYLSPGDFSGTRYLHVSPRHTRTCVIEHVKTRTRSTITVREVAYDTGLGDDLFTIAHLGEGR